MSKPTHPYGLDFARARSLGLWLPNNNLGATNATFGIPLTQEGTVTLNAPANTVGGYMLSQRFANVAGVANNVAGLRYPTAAHHQLLRGNTNDVGGFYCSFRFTIGLWPANTSRFFVGISAATTNVAAVDCGADGTAGTLPNNTAGWMHESTDGANVIRWVSKGNGGNVSNTVVSGGATPTVVAVGQSYWAEIFQWANTDSTIGSTMVGTLWDMNLGASMFNGTTGNPLNTTFCGPQVCVSNGSVAGNVAAIDVSNVYWFAGD